MITRFTPTQDEIDTLGGGSTKQDWEARHELAYQKSRERNVTLFGSPVLYALYFGRYLYRKHHVYPKDLWQIKLVVTASYVGGNTRFAPAIHALFGKSADIRDIYGASEGLFGAQMDDKKAWTPFYDLVFFEVQTINGIKQLHEMYPGEIGSLIISTPIFPRYRIGDLILAFEPPYFRCIGRENSKLHPYNFGKLTGKSAINFPKSIPLNSWR
jgi:hypothetical protein